jgi:hypothetical protein
MSVEHAGYRVIPFPSPLELRYSTGRIRNASENGKRSAEFRELLRVGASRRASA